MKKFDKIEDEFIEIEVDGKLKKYDLLFSFDCKENGRTYVAFTDGSFDEEGDAVVCYASYDPSDQNSLLYDVNTQMELDMIDEVIDGIQKEILDGKEK